MSIRLTPTNSLILGGLFLVAGVATVAADGATVRSILFCVIGLFGLIGGLVTGTTGGGGEVASEKVQRRRRERFGRRR